MVKYKFELVGKEEKIIEITDEELEKAARKNICEIELIEMIFADWIKDKEKGKANYFKI